VEALGSIRLPPPEQSQFVAAMQQPHPSVLRCRREVDPSVLPWATEPIAWYSLARRTLDPQAQPSRSLAYHAGDFYLQDAGSLLALAVCDADTSSRAPSWVTSTASPETARWLVCDLCAAPGGKATALLEALGEHGFLLANEPIQSRLAPLAYNLSRTGSDRYAISSYDPERLADRLGGIFDLVLVDAPCSGQALLGKGRQSSAALSSRQIEHSAARQSRILDAAVRLLRKSGRLVYSTCTFAELENEVQVQRLVDTRACVVQPVSRLSSYVSPCLEGCYRLWPHRHQCAGSFSASMEVIQKTEVPRRWKGGKPHKPPTDLSPWFDFGDATFRFSTVGSMLLGWREEVPPWAVEIATGGPELAHRTGQTWKPAHAAALRRDVSPLARQRIDVDADTAIEFLQGQPIACEANGWQVVCHEGRPLGWIKGTAGVGKNQLFPAARVSTAIVR